MVSGFAKLPTAFTSQQKGRKRRRLASGLARGLGLARVWLGGADLGGGARGAKLWEGGSPAGPKIWARNVENFNFFGGLQGQRPKKDVSKISTFFFTFPGPGEKKEIVRS